MAPADLMRPGALSWNHGAVLVLKALAAAKERRHPAETEDKKTLSTRMLPFFTPALDTSSMVSAGVYAARFSTLKTGIPVDPERAILLFSKGVLAFRLQN